MSAAAYCALGLIAAWLVLRTVRELFIAWYNGVEIEMPVSAKVTIGLQILVCLAVIWFALMQLAA